MNNICNSHIEINKPDGCLEPLFNKECSDVHFRSNDAYKNKNPSFELLSIEIYDQKADKVYETNDFHETLNPTKTHENRKSGYYFIALISSFGSRHNRLIDSYWCHID